MIEEIEKLIKETEQWRAYHRQNHYPIDASACAIRLKALNDVLAIAKKMQTIKTNN